jgi:predicted oxidoreductase
MKNRLTLSPLIAGTMKWGQWGSKFTTNQYLDIINHCVDLGITSFDHADIYGDYTTEEEFGKALKEKPSLRQQVQLITKCGIKMVSPNRPAHMVKSYDTSFEHIVSSVERSLTNFETDYIDVLLIHRPDPLMNADEIARAFEYLRTSGKVLNFGVSNFSPFQLDLLHSRFPICCNQVEVSIINLSPFTDGTLDQCQHRQIVPMAWSPLGGGNIFADETDERKQRISAMAALMAEKYDTTPDIILLSWLFQHPSGIIPVLGTSRKERIRAAIKALEIKLSREDWFFLWRASTGKEVA